LSLPRLVRDATGEKLVRLGVGHHRLQLFPAHRGLSSARGTRRGRCGWHAGQRRCASARTKFALASSAASGHASQARAVAGAEFLYHRIT
jgi:hypothetical protein